MNEEMSLKLKWRAERECVGVEWHCALNFCLHQMFLWFTSAHICFLSLLTSTPLFPSGVLPPPSLCSESLFLAMPYLWIVGSANANIFFAADSSRLLELLKSIPVSGWPSLCHVTHWETSGLYVKYSMQPFYSFTQIYI